MCEYHIENLGMIKLVLNKKNVEKTRQSYVLTSYDHYGLKDYNLAYTMEEVGREFPAVSDHMTAQSFKKILSTLHSL